MVDFIEALSISMLLSTCVLVLVLAWCLKIREEYNLFKTLNIPGPKPVMIFGNILEFRNKNPLDVFKQWRKTYGDIFGFFEGFMPKLVINCPEMAKQILVKEFEKFHIRPLINPFVYTPDENSLLNMHGAEWKGQRSIFASAFNSTSMKHLSDSISHIGEKFCTKVTIQKKSNPEGFNITSLVDRYILDSFAKSCFDFNTNSLDNEDVLSYRFMKAFNQSAASPISRLARIYHLLIPLLQPFDYKHKKAREASMKEIREHVSRKLIEYSQSSNEKHKTLLGQMLRRSSPGQNDNGNNTGPHLDVEEIAGHINSLIGGSIQATNACLSFVIHMLAVNPQAQQKALEEVIELCGYDESPSFEDLRKMEYLDMFINETLRLLPCAPGVARTCTENCNINGVHFKKGVNVVAMMCTLYCDDRVFPNPDQFIPERFSPEEVKKRHPFSFLPFGQGPRICPGLRLANLQVKIAVVKLLQRFEIKPCSQTIDPLPTALRPMIVPKDGVFVQLNDRVRRE